MCAMVSMEEICVIGGAGFVGSHVVNEALARGYKVRCTMRDTSDETKKAWLRQLPNANDVNLSFFCGNLIDVGSYDEAIKGCQGVVVCALPEKPSSQELIDTVKGGVEHILASCTLHGVKSIVITSSGGSTNPKEGEPPIKNELEHWSDPDFQISQGKYSPAAKTLMEKMALKYAEDHPELKIVILNPNLIMGPMFQPEVPESGSLRFLLKMLKKESFTVVANGSMSVIDVRDLAKLELNALEMAEAKGRYFGVLKSFHYKDLLSTLKKVYPAYEMPKQGYKGEDIVPTQFDHTRKNSLGVELRELEVIFRDAVDDLKKRGLI